MTFLAILSFLEIFGQEFPTSLIILASALAALATIYKFILKPVYRRILAPIISKNFIEPIVHTMSDTNSPIGKGLVTTIIEVVGDSILPLKQAQIEINQKLDTIVHEMQTNNGTSIKDAIKRIEESNNQTVEILTNDKIEWLALLEGNTKATETASLEIRLRFRELATGSSVALIETNSLGEIILVNKAWCSLTGLTLEDARDNSPTGWSKAMEIHEAERIYEIWEDVLLNRRETFGPLDCTYILPDGSKSYVTMSSTALHDKDGNVSGWLGSLTPRQAH